MIGNALAYTNRVLFMSTSSVNGITSLCFHLTVGLCCVNSCSNSLCAERISVNDKNELNTKNKFYVTLRIRN